MLLRPCDLIESLSDWEYLGVSRLDSGEIIFGKDYSEVRKRYFHVIFPGISNESLDEFLERNYGLRDSVYSKQLSLMNGATLFGGKFFFFGIRGLEVYAENPLLLPFEIWSINLEKSALRQALEGFIFGGYDHEGERYYCVETADGRFLISRDVDISQVQEFDSLSKLYHSALEKIIREV